MRARSFTILILTILCVASFTPSELHAQSGSAKELEQANKLSAQVLKLYGEKKFSEALPLAQKVLEIRSRLLPRNDVLTGSALINLGEIYLATRKDRDAADAFEKALAIYDSPPQPDQMTIVRLLNSLAYVKIRKHDFGQADAMLLRALAIQEKEFGRTNPVTIEAMKDYACLEIRNRAGTENLLLEDKNETRMNLRARALCWLGGLTNDCSGDSKFVSSRNVVNGMALRLYQSAYPSEARREGLSGEVFVAVLIDENGYVIAASPVCGGPRELNLAGLEAARRSKFSVTKMDDQPVRVTGLIIYRFIAN